MNKSAYTQLTECAESDLNFYRRMIKEHENDSDKEMMHVYNCMANGCIGLWRKATADIRGSLDDLKRLENIIKGE